MRSASTSPPYKSAVLSMSQVGVQGEQRHETPQVYSQVRRRRDGHASLLHSSCSREGEF